MLDAPAYLLRFAVTSLAGIFFVALVNLSVDPYFVFGSPSIAGFNEIKTRARERESAAKFHILERQVFAGLILGNSRAELGFDPHHPMWPQNAHPVYNAAIPGAGVEITERVLRFAVDRGGVEYAVIGLDFLDFRVNPSAEDSDRPPGPLLTVSQRWRDRLEAALTFQSALDSAQTVITQGFTASPRLTAAGFNPMTDYTAIARRDGYYMMFRQRDIENARNYLRGHKSIFRDGTKTSVHLARVRRMAEQCNSRHVRCDFVIYPYHSHIHLLFQETGLWNLFWEWKLALREIVRDAKTGGTKARLLDFSAPSVFSTEAIPSRDERGRGMRWYWEAGHFKKELGDLVLHRIFSRQAEVGSDLFGANLLTGDISVLKAVAEERLKRYVTGRKTEVEELVAMVAEARTAVHGTAVKVE